MRKLWLLVVLVGLASMLAVGTVVAAPGGATNPDTLKELAQARQATKQYHDLAAAEADGYVDFGFAPQMGYHYFNVTLPDEAFETFDLEKPAILLYADGGPNGRRLVGVEYLVLPQPDGSEPDGFTGDSDTDDNPDDEHGWWLHRASCHYVDGSEIEGVDDPEDCPETHPDTGAELEEWDPDFWALHVWLWQGNPDGMFAMFNPSLP